MSRPSDYKIVGEALLVNVARVGEWNCRGPLDGYLHSRQVAAREALERLVDAEPFAQW